MQYFKYISVLVISISILLSSGTALGATVSESAESLTLGKDEIESLGTSAQPSEIQIPCHLHIDNPHISTHETPNINVVAWVRCTGIVSEVKMAITLRRNGVELGTVYFTDRNRSFFKNHMDTPCVSGTYQGRLFATVTPASSINRSSGYAFSNQVYIQCP